MPHMMVMVLVIIAAQLCCINAFPTPHGCHYLHYPIPNLIRLQQSQNNDNEINNSGIRLNKVFKATHSRREADKLIESGRVSVNGEPVLNKGGMKVVPFQDEISLDGKIIREWEKMNAIYKNDVDTSGNLHDVGENLNTASFEYVKYFKPIGVTCTTDSRVKGNIIDEIRRDGYNPRHRVYPVGRLDKETSGLIVLTSDGRMVNSVLRGERKQPKVYKVMVNGRLEEDDLQQLRDGIVISTVAQRKGRSEEENTLVARTKKCKVERIGPSSCQMTLVEGRNRQIRKMMEALGFRVVKLHRVEFMGIQLMKGLAHPGDWSYLDEDEMKLVENAMLLAQEEN
ncbi:hypothetical protein ACHAXR_005180 [Thalassiosira sp. AJA248-18]